MAQIAGKSDSEASRVWNRFKGEATCICELSICLKKVKYSERRVGLLQICAEDLKNV
jgi:hypothetical protein